MILCRADDASLQSNPLGTDTVPNKIGFSSYVVSRRSHAKVWVGVGERVSSHSSCLSFQMVVLLINQ